MDAEASRLHNIAWDSVWTSLRGMTDAGKDMESTLFTIRGGFNICDDFLRSGCKRLAQQALTMTLAYTMPDELQHRMDDCLAKAEVKVPDLNFGAGKIQVKKGQQ